MQPYFFPYIGYFQLMHAVDLFVIYDDAQYMKGGWINRNRILIHGDLHWLTLPVRRASVHLAINQREYAFDAGWMKKLKKRLTAGYARAPAYGAVSRPLFEWLDHPDRNVAGFNGHSLTAVAKALGITCDFATSSELDLRPESRGEEKVLSICRHFGADHYINPVGGMALYDAGTFADAGIRLSFLKTSVDPVPTNAGPQHLSVIDAMMREGFERLSGRLPAYALLDNHQERMA